MAGLFNQGKFNSAQYFGKTQTRLFVSGTDAPAERLIVSKEEDKKFDYLFGYEGNQGVLIAKGKMVSLAGQERDWETGKLTTAVKIANGTVAKEAVDAPVGINMFNAYERPYDEMKGNLPTIVTRGYIELPYFSSKEAADAIHFGAFHSAVDAQVGQLVRVDSNGNLTTDATEGEAPLAHVVGRVVAIDTELPPMGFLQYFLDMDDTIWADLLKEIGIEKKGTRNLSDDNPLNNFGSFPGELFYKRKAELLKTFDQGIPYLTDGYNMRKKTVAIANTEVVVGTKAIQKVATTEGSTFAGGTFTKNPADAVSALFVKFDKKEFKLAVPDKSDADVANDKTVAATGTGVVGTHVDYENNMVIVYMDQDCPNLALTVFGLDMTKAAGIPTNWDFQGSKGGIRILLECSQF